MHHTHTCFGQHVELLVVHPDRVDRHEAPVEEALSLQQTHGCGAVPLLDHLHLVVGLGEMQMARNHQLAGNVERETDRFRRGRMERVRSRLDRDEVLVIEAAH